MRKFVGWQTIDGEIFVSETEAKEHEAKLEMIKLMRIILGEGSRWTIEYIATVLAGNGYVIARAPWTVEAPK